MIGDIGRSSSNTDRSITGSVSDKELAVLKAVRVSGTERSVEYRLNHSDQIDRFIENDLDLDSDITNIHELLSNLELKGYVEYLGHGEWEISDTGNELLQEGTESDIGSPKKVASRSVIHPRSSLLNLAAYLLILAVSIYQVSHLLGTGELCQDVGRFLILAVLVPLLITISAIHIFQYGSVLTRFFVSNFIRMENKFANFDSEEKQEAYEESEFDKAHRAMANTFRYWGFLFIPAALVLISLIDMYGNLANQSYGLILDATGGIYLALEVTRTDKLGSSGVDLGSQDYGDETKTVTDGIWGALFLISGFSIQLLSLLPWGSVFPAVEICV
jgi:hypothetical protein